MEKTRLRWIWTLVLVLLLCGAAREVRGQRVYATIQQSSPNILLSSVSNNGNAIDFPDTTNYSTLKVTVGLLGLVTAQQNLQFTTSTKPSKTSPVMIKIGTTASLLTLLEGISVQRTNGGLTAVVPPSYSSATLLNLLNLFQGSVIGVVVIPSDGSSYDGVRFEVNTTLGVALTAYNYYAFYITPPQLSSQTVTLCEGASSSVAISNFDVSRGYTYRLYSTETGGTSLSQTTSNTLDISSTMEGAFWVEAREGDLYPSARTKIEIVRNKISNNTISSNQSICQEEIPSLINGVIPTAVGATISYQWQSKTTGGYANILGAMSPSFQPPKLLETTTYQRVVTATLNGVSCVSSSNEITVTIKPRSPAPNIEIHPNSQ